MKNYQHSSSLTETERQVSNKEVAKTRRELEEELKYQEALIAILVNRLGGRIEIDFREIIPCIDLGNITLIQTSGMRMINGEMVYFKELTTMKGDNQ